MLSNSRNSPDASQQIKQVNKFCCSLDLTSKFLKNQSIYLKQYLETIT